MMSTPTALLIVAAVLAGLAIGIAALGYETHESRLALQDIANTMDREQR